MADEYLWDRTGPVDPEVADLEAVLAGLRMAPSGRAPSVSPRVVTSPSPHGARVSTTLVTAVLAAAATMALIWTWARVTRPDAPLPGPPQIMIVAPPAPVAAPPPSPPVPPPSPAVPNVPALPTTVPPPPGATDVPAPAVSPVPDTAAPRRRRTTPRRPAAPAVANGGYAVDCILDPTACEDGGSKTAAVSPSDKLPETLTAGNIKEGIEPHKARAHACGETYAASGAKVVIKLSIAGATGKVTHSTATGAFAGTELGRCVAKVFEAAEFPRFRRVSIGVQYPVRMQ
jgi:hypothetical protein